MKQLREFVKSTLVGGLLVVLPLGLLSFALVWVLGLIRGAIAPLTHLAMKYTPLQAIAGDIQMAADVLVIVVLICLCFMVGVIVRTRLSKWVYLLVETNLLCKTPGYSLIKETVHQFLGKKQSPFSSVALAQVFGNETLVSAFITDTHEDGSYTVFVPTGPNPTSGCIYHLKGQYVHPVKASVEDTMRSIISCGAGSSALISKLAEQKKIENSGK